MSYDPRFDRYRSPNFKRPKPSGDSLRDSFAARTGWGKQAKPRANGSFGRSPQQRAPAWGRPVERLKPSKFRLWAVWALLMLGGLGLAVNLFYLQVTRAPALRKQAEQQQTLKTKPFVPRRPIVDRAGMFWRSTDRCTRYTLTPSCLTTRRRKLRLYWLRCCRSK
jgi:Cell division protein FtsI/penicillin-binding protein 2